MRLETDLQTLMLSNEDLHPDLARSVRTDTGFPIVSHRYYVGMAFPHGVTNAQYAFTKAAAAEARAERNWSRYIGLHARPFRVDALIDAIDDGLDKDSKEYWRAVSGVWTDSENIYQFHDDWVDIWLGEVPDREHSMTSEELKTLSALPDQVPVWRGAGCEAAQWGLSWTFNKNKALWFARRFQSKQKFLVHGLASKDEILAHFAGRNEDELVIHPASVRVQKVTRA